MRSQWSHPLCLPICSPLTGHLSAPALPQQQLQRRATRPLAVRPLEPSRRWTRDDTRAGTFYSIGDAVRFFSSQWHHRSAPTSAATIPTHLVAPTSCTTTCARTSPHWHSSCCWAPSSQWQVRSQQQQRAGSSGRSSAAHRIIASSAAAHRIASASVIHLHPPLFPLALWPSCRRVRRQPVVAPHRQRRRPRRHRAAQRARIVRRTQPRPAATASGARRRQGIRLRARRLRH